MKAQKKEKEDPELKRPKSDRRVKTAHKSRNAAREEGIGPESSIDGWSNMGVAGTEHDVGSDGEEGQIVVGGKELMTIINTAMEEAAPTNGHPQESETESQAIRESLTPIFRSLCEQVGYKRAVSLYSKLAEFVDDSDDDKAMMAAAAKWMIVQVTPAESQPHAPRRNREVGNNKRRNTEGNGEEPKEGPRKER